jgi:vitamin B12 transporter
MTEGIFMNLSKPTLLSLAVASSFSSSIWATPNSLDQIIVSASRVEQAKADYTGNITVITSEQLEEKSIQTLPEALDRIAGIPMYSNGGQGKATSLYLRGHNSSRTLLLVDGVRFNDPTSLNGANWEHILVSDIERIEILPGAQAGIWGADAGAGVINVITKQAGQGTHASLSYAMGDLGQKNTKLNASYGQQNFDARISLQSLSEDGFSALTPIVNGSPQNPLDYEKDGYRNDTANVKLGWNLANKQRLEAGGTFVDANNRYDSYDSLYVSQPNDKNTHGTYKQNIGYLSYTFNIQDWQTKVSTQQGNMLRKEFGYSGADNGRYDVDINQNSIISSKSDLLGSWSLGAEQIAQNAKQMGLGTERGRYEQLGYFINRTQKFHLPQADQPTIVNVGLRKDGHNRYDDYVSKSLGLKQPLTKDSYLSFNLGDRQRTPNLFERFGGGWTQASPNLTPETIESREVSLGWKGYSITHFEDQVNNLIGYGANSYINVKGTAQLTGWEWKAEQAIPFLASELALTYTVLDAKDKDGKQLAQRPENSGSINWTYLGLSKSLLSVQGQYMGKRTYGAGYTGMKTGNYWLWHANASYQWDKSVRVFVKGVNLTDERIIQGNGFSDTYYAYSPRTILAGVEYKF